MKQGELFEYFSQGIASYAANVSSRVSGTPVCAFFPLKGKRYSRDLMIVGRATNRWLDEQHKKNGTAGSTSLQLQNGPQRESFLSVIKADCTTDDPMSWVVKERYGEKYQSWRSAFWRVAEKVFVRLRETSSLNDEWPSHLVWSNLYKVAPEQGGNPGMLMRRAQESWCLEMLEMEIKLFRPKNILFMTGYDSWANPFLQRLGFVRTSQLDLPWGGQKGQLRLTAGGECKVAVVPHPQGKPEAEIVEQVVRSFR